MTRYWRTFAIILALLFAPQSALAAVTITFYSHELGSNFPHAFVVLKGTVDATGEKVDSNFGFTAKNVSPGILFGSVNGRIDIAKPKFIQNSNPHFSLVLTDTQYAKVLAKVEAWRTRPGKSYNLNKANCVHFVADIAQMLGLKVNAKSEFIKKPRSYLNEVMALNPGLKL